MKHFFFIFVLAFMTTSFTSNKTNTLESVGWNATCYVTIRNSETGETRRVYGSGSGGTQAEALANCGSNATATARMLVGMLNKQ